jgi:NodT family efflux transporter outer membrane factor (OMF) lipoprotein
MKITSYQLPVSSKMCLCIFWACVMMTAGCTVGPDYKPQEPNMPAAYTGRISTAETPAEYTNLVQWWTVFNDPNMTSLVDRAVKSNLDLLQAEARIRQARAARGVAAAGFWPTADTTGSYARSRSGGSSATYSNLFKAGLDAAWELDIFGGTRRSIEAAEADIQFAVEDHRDVLVTLVSEVSLNYVELRGFQQEIVIARDNLKAQQHTAELTRKRFQGGLVGSLDVANADAQVATTASQIPTMETSAQQAIYNLSVLLGREPAALLEELSSASLIPTTPPEVPMGIPSKLLRRRPDIRRAEAQIHSATARIGVATADLFPKFSLTGSLNFQSNQLNRLINWNNRSWSFGPAVDWQIFNAGSVSSNIELQKALQQETMLVYQKTVLTALQDVENALVAYANEHQRRKALVDAVAANRNAVELATKLYAQGQTDFLNVLNAQRSLYGSEDALVQSTRNLSTDLVALYKALGGGWDTE